MDDDYLKYDLERKAHRRRDRDIPIYIEFNGSLVNPRKQDFMNYEVSSIIKEKLILENSSIALKNCLYMALGSEYLIPIPAKRGLFSVILYLDVLQLSGFYRENYYLLESRELVQDLSKDYRLKKIKHLDYFPSESIEKTLFDEFIHRSLQTEFTFEQGKTYQLEIESNPYSSLPIGSYTESYKSKFFREETVPGFTITLKELPPNTKFAFDGKDDVGKTYEQVKKEFILYDKDAEQGK
ncbi:MAG: hypothetical protein KBF93_21800 [Leptospiraceae bacterium]|nr:hypothetical protein [Leptospiraceae bacterium]